MLGCCRCQVERGMDTLRQRSIVPVALSGQFDPARCEVAQKSKDFLGTCEVVHASHHVAGPRYQL